jgi:thiamine-monophosphate kinase
VGGDLTQTSGFLGASLTLTGHSARPLLRTGARTGGALYVTGLLGGSLCGWHLDFTPRLAEGRYLASRAEVVSCIDVTDGIAKDLPALLGPGQAAALDIAALPASPAALRLAAGDPAHLPAASWATARTTSCSSRSLQRRMSPR